MRNSSLKLVILGSVLVLVMLALAGGVYVWTNSSLKEVTPVATTSSTTSGSSTGTTPATVTTSKAVTATSNNVDANGNLKDSAVFGQ